MNSQEVINNTKNDQAMHANNKQRPTYRKKGKLKASQTKRSRHTVVGQNLTSTREKIGKNIDFASNESYKLLRTNLTYTLDNTESCNIFGVTSSIPGEGKSTTSINLSIAFAETEKKVLLIEADMRKPVLEKYFNVKTSKGLSTALAGICKPKDIVYKSSKYHNLYIITAGEIPPNPAELLSSSNMKKLLDELKSSFDMIIIDLPPVRAVVDAIVVSKLTQGLVLVVRDGYIHKKDLADTIRQLKIADTKILGIAYNDKDATKHKAYKYQDEYRIK